jgi:hypothetical protein
VLFTPTPMARCSLSARASTPFLLPNPGLLLMRVIEAGIGGKEGQQKNDLSCPPMFDALGALGRARLGGGGWRG